MKLKAIFGILIFMGLLLTSCVSKKTYEVDDNEGNETKLTLYSDSTFKHKILKESLELNYEGTWEGGQTNGDTLITTATIVNDDPLSNRYTSTYYFSDEKPILINFIIH